MKEDQKNLRILLDSYFSDEKYKKPDESLMEFFIYLPFSDLADAKDSLGIVFLFY